MAARSPAGAGIPARSPANADSLSERSVLELKYYRRNFSEPLADADCLFGQDPVITIKYNQGDAKDVCALLLCNYGIVCKPGSCRRWDHAEDTFLLSEGKPGSTPGEVFNKMWDTFLNPRRLPGTAGLSDFYIMNVEMTLESPPDDDRKVSTEWTEFRVAYDVFAWKEREK